MIKVYVWEDWNTQATVYTLKEFEDKFNKQEMDNNNTRIEFFVASKRN